MFAQAINRFKNLKLSDLITLWGNQPSTFCLIEDEPLVRALLKSPLEAVGFQRKSASSAADAKSATKDFEPQVAILDALHMLTIGQSNHEIAAQRGTAVRAVELLVKRALAEAVVDADAPGNARVVAARQFTAVSGDAAREQVKVRDKLFVFFFLRECCLPS